MKVLLVDDDHDVHVLAGHALATLRGWEVVSVHDGGEAVATAQRERPAVVLLDVMMPAVDGREVLRRLRREAALAAVPVIFLTGRDEPGVAAELLALGACGVLVKPFLPAALPDEIERLLAAADAASGAGGGTAGYGNGGIEPWRPS